MFWIKYEACVLLIFSVVLFFSGQKTLAGDLVREEQIGQISLGMPESAIFSLLAIKPEQGSSELWGADGLYHQTLTFSTLGIELDMAGDAKEGIKNVASITVIAPCPFATKRGIRIGSSEKKVVETYHQEFAKEDSTEGEIFVAGSVYGGLIFHFQQGKVDQIFLGAAAE